MNQYIGFFTKAVVCVSIANLSIKDCNAQVNWPTNIPQAKSIDSEHIGVFSRGDELPDNVKADASLSVNSSSIPIDGLLVRAGIMSLEPRRTYIMFSHIHSGPEKSVVQKESSFYWASTAIGLTHPLWSPDGQTISMREGPRSLERGDSSNILLWDLKSSIIEPIKPIQGSKPIYWPFFQWSPGSRYLSYLRGGSARGDFDEWVDPYELYVYDTKNKIERKLLANTDLFWSWTTNGKILVVGPTSSENSPVQNSLGADKRAPIYEIDVATLKKEKIIEQGAFPFASPDNKWVAFFNWRGSLFEPSTDLDGPKSPQRGLYLWRRSDRKTFFVKPLNLTHEPLLYWSLDSKKIYAVEEQTQQSPPIIYQFDGIEGLRNDVNINENSYWHRIITLPKSSMTTAYSLKGTSSTGKILFVDAKEFSEQPDGLLHLDYRLSAFDTETGRLYPVLNDINVGEGDFWEWRDTSGPTPPQNSAKKLEETLPAWAK